MKPKFNSDPNSTLSPKPEIQRILPFTDVRFRFFQKLEKLEVFLFI